MANRRYDQFSGTLRKGVVKLYGRITTTTSGTVGSSTSAKLAGFTVTKTASEAGRYTITLQDKYNELLGISATVIGAADAAYGAGKGLAFHVRNDAVTTTKTVDVQFSRTNGTTDYNDTEVADGAIILLEITLSNSGV